MKMIITIITTTIIRWHTIVTTFFNWIFSTVHLIFRFASRSRSSKKSFVGQWINQRGSAPTRFNNGRTVITSWTIDARGRTSFRRVRASKASGSRRITSSFGELSFRYLQLYKKSDAGANVVEKFKEFSNSVWVSFEAVIIEKTLKEKWIDKNNFDDNYN